eukprot:3269868-Alexandrium_andersonii.AAC.1
MFVARQDPRIAWIAARSSADWSPRLRDAAASDPLNPDHRWQIRNLHGQCRRARPSGASWAHFDR